MPIAGFPLYMIWNPGRRHSKALLDITKELMQLIAAKAHRRQIELSIPYLALLTFVSSLPRMDSEVCTQFAIVMAKSSAQNQRASIIFTSSLHSLA